MNNLVPVNNLKIFDGEEENTSIDNTVWAVQNKKLYSLGNLIQHPGFDFDGSSLFLPHVKSLGRELKQIMLCVECTQDQALFIINRFKTGDKNCSLGYFMKLNLNGEIIKNIGVVLHPCAFETAIPINNLKKENFFTCEKLKLNLVFLTGWGVDIFYADKSIYTDPDPALQHFIRLNSLHINCRKPKDRKENPQLAQTQRLLK